MNCKIFKSLPSLSVDLHSGNYNFSVGYNYLLIFDDNSIRHSYNDEVFDYSEFIEKLIEKGNRGISRVDENNVIIEYYDLLNRTWLMKGKILDNDEILLSGKNPDGRLVHFFYERLNISI